MSEYVYSFGNHHFLQINIVEVVIYNTTKLVCYVRPVYFRVLVLAASCPLNVMYGLPDKLLYPGILPIGQCQLRHKMFSNKRSVLSRNHAQGVGLIIF